MSEVTIQPIRSYQDGGQIRSARSAPYVVPARHAKQLEARGLCRIIENDRPKAEAGESSFASPADQALPPTIASVSGDGEPRRRRGRPSARTQHSD